MGQAIGGSLALAVGVALSPVPIIAVVLMLTSRRARANGPLSVLGWLAGLAVVGAIVLSVSGPAGASSPGSPATWVSWVKVVLGQLLLVVAARQFRGRPKDGQPPVHPPWVTRAAGGRATIRHAGLESGSDL
jgi:hypothetical protein